MTLWNTRQEDLTTKVNSREKINKSGVYELEIKEAYLMDSTQSKAQAVTLAFENDTHYGRASLWFLKGDGEPNLRAEKLLNRMMYLSKFKADHNLKMEKKKTKLYNGKEIERTFLSELHGKKLGVILEAKKDGENINLEINDFFDIKSRKTSDEILNKTEAETVAKAEEKYKDAKPQETNKNDLPYETDKNVITDSSVLSDDEFPF